MQYELSLAQQYGWGIVMHPNPDGTIQVRTANAQNANYIDMIATCCATFLGTLRDEHPDPDIANIAATTLLALKKTASSEDSASDYICY